MENLGGDRSYGYANQNPYNMQGQQPRGGPNMPTLSANTNPNMMPTRSQSAPEQFNPGMAGRGGSYQVGGPNGNSNMQPMFASILSRDNSRQQSADVFDPNSFPSLSQSNIRYPTQPNMQQQQQQQQQPNISQQQQQQQQHISPPGSLLTSSNPQSNQQQFQINQQIISNDDFHQDDFPALGRGGLGPKDSSLSNPALLNPNANASHSSGNPSSIFNSSNAAGMGSLPVANNTNVGSLSDIGTSSNMANMSSPPMTPQSIQASIDIAPGCLLIPGLTPDPKLRARYGLAGMLDYLKSDRDSSSLALGTDLNSLGLNINSGDFLYLSFSSPFDEPDAKPEPKYTLPQCYNSTVLQPLKQEHVSKFDLATLFYMFYSLVKDVMQVRASLELYRREWKYHGELKVWIRQRSPAEMAQSLPTVQHIFFDIAEWKEKPYNQPIRPGFLTEEDIRASSVSPQQQQQQPQQQQPQQLQQQQQQQRPTAMGGLPP